MSEESVHRLVDRELAALLHESQSLGDRVVEPGAIHLATNRIRIELLSKSRRPRQDSGSTWKSVWAARGRSLATGLA